MQPIVTDVNQLIKNGEYMGYQEGSYVLGILEEMNFDPAKLRTYKSIEECDEILSKGSANGGIAAAFDDIPCMKILLSQYCSKYTMVQSIYKTDGLGFVSSLARSHSHSLTLSLSLSLSLSHMYVFVLVCSFSCRFLLF